jgi:starch phosphorylase
MITAQELFPYSISEEYAKPIAYFSMEFAIDQTLKIYSGGLGFLAGSHMRSAYELRQNLVGIGILWKYGYYDQGRNKDQTLRVDFVEKHYSFLTDTGIVFPIIIHNSKVMVKAWLLKPGVFRTAPVFLLSTNLPENDHLAQTICYRLYDNHESARIAQSILLGSGGARLLEILGRETEIYHLNEGHALPVCFHLLKKYDDLEEVKKRVVFTTHTPEKAGNEEHDIAKLDVMGFFQGVPRETVMHLAEPDTRNLNYTLCALRMSKVANGVSAMHGQVSREMWKSFERISLIRSVTNAQNHTYWKDETLERCLADNDLAGAARRKREMKRNLFRVVANQSGKLFREDVLTVVWARRFAAYKRANLVLRDMERFRAISNHPERPVQFIWAGKPYPEDHAAVGIFSDLCLKTKFENNCTILTGYEMELSALLKKGSDVWLNNPRLSREASGTSGMTAAMNGSINLSIPDGWVPEFARHLENCFVIEPADRSWPVEEQDAIESDRIYSLLEDVIVPMYYGDPGRWNRVLKQSHDDVLPMFDSGRMAGEYYEKLYRF